MASPSTLRGLVVLVPFPFDDLSSSKLRPAVCLTDSIGVHQHVVVAFITSRAVLDPLPTDLVLRPSESDFSLSGLRVASTIRLHRLTTITTSIIQRELGQLTPERMDVVGRHLAELFHLRS